MSTAFPSLKENHGITVPSRAEWYGEVEPAKPIGIDWDNKRHKKEAPAVKGDYVLVKDIPESQKPYHGLLKPPKTETDPTGRPAHSHGSKLDAGKPPVWRGVLDYFGKAVRAVATVSLYGSTKYVWKGWEGVPDGVERYADAVGRHMTDTGTVPEADEELVKYLAVAFPKVQITPEIVHASQAAWNALATLELRLRAATRPPQVISVPGIAGISGVSVAVPTL